MVSGKGIVEDIEGFFRLVGYRDSLSIDREKPNKLHFQDLSFLVDVNDDKNIDVMVSVPEEREKAFGNYFTMAGDIGFYNDRISKSLRERQKKNRKRLTKRKYKIDEDGSFHFKADINPSGRDRNYQTKLSVGIVDYVIRPSLVIERILKDKKSKQ